MGFVWITFATENNIDGDIDYLAQEISRSGLRTRLHPLFPGEDDKIDRLMPAFLGRPDQCDAWILYASAESLGGDRIDKLRRVVEHAEAQRAGFPRIGLPTNADTLAKAEQISLSSRIFVDDPEWRGRLSAALGADLPGVASNQTGLPPYVAKLQPLEKGPFRYTFEFRPKMKRWDPVLFAILPEERSLVAPEIQNHPYEEGFSDDAEWYFLRGQVPATPQNSYVVAMKGLPTRLAFGQEGADEVVVLNMRPPN
ncbi:MAG TPA: hypothetical protein VEX68_06810 [Bryobacteraceae bacterium]|nr:hypothetical protein [Bryobacteraceae bacterium]